MKLRQINSFHLWMFGVRKLYNKPYCCCCSILPSPLFNSNTHLIKNYWHHNIYALLLDSPSPAADADGCAYTANPESEAAGNLPPST